MLYRSRPGNEAKAVAAQHRAEQLARVEGVEGAGEGLERWEFETWPEQRDVSDKNEYLCLYWTSRGALRVDGAFKMQSEKLRFIHEEGGSASWVDLAKPVNTLLERRFIPADCQRMAVQLKSHIIAIWNAAEMLGDDARRIHLSDLKAVLDLGFSQS